MLTRDPISEWFDPAARRLLKRAYDHRGQWVGVYIAPPTLAQQAAAARLGIYNLYESDGTEVRWIRAFKRSAYWHLRYYGRSGRIDFTERRAAAGYNTPFAAHMEWETGRLTRRPGGHWGWAVRVRLHRSVPRDMPRSGDRSLVSDRDWG